MGYLNYKNKSRNSFTAFFSKYWIFGALFLVYPYLVRYMRNAETKDKQNEIKNLLGNAHLTADTLNDALNEVSGNDQKINADAYNIADALGVLHNWTSWAFYYEDEDLVHSILMKYKPIPMTLQNAYLVITKGRSLKNDVSKYMESKHKSLYTWQ